MHTGAVAGYLGREDSSGMTRVSKNGKGEPGRKTDVIMMKPSLGRQWQEERQGPGTPEGAWPSTVWASSIPRKGARSSQAVSREAPANRAAGSAQRVPFPAPATPGLAAPSPPSSCFLGWDVLSLH